MSEEHDQYAKYLALKVVVYALCDAHPSKQRLLALLDEKSEHVTAALLPTAMPEDALSIFRAELEAIRKRLSRELHQ